MGFVRQNIVPVAVFSISIAVIVVAMVHIGMAPQRHVRKAYIHSTTFPPLPGQEVERVVSPTGAYVAVVYSSDGAGVSPTGSTIMLHSVPPMGTSSGPVAIAFTPSETLPFQGIHEINVIECYNDLSILEPNWHGVGIQFKHRDATSEMP